MEAPVPLVKEPLKISKGGVGGLRPGRGFSRGEVEAVGLNVEQARLLGIYVDTRRRSAHEENIKALREWLIKVLKGEAGPLPPALPKSISIKPKRGRAFRGLTTAGRRARGLLGTRYKETHHRKFKKKARERAEKRRHETTRGLGNLQRISKIK
jgi:large subunit ribosomal protein L13e|nr:MAG: 50S ribosomal protein L13 [Thermoproteus sp. AZ2]